MGKGLLSVVIGNTPAVRGAVVDQLRRLSPHAVALSVSLQAQGAGYPVVQRFLSGADAFVRDACRAATGDPLVILRQDLLSLRRSSDPLHVVLCLPEDIDVLPFLVKLWRARVGSGSLADYYDRAPMVAGVEPAPFMMDIGCVHQAVRLWTGRDRGESLTPAEVAVRQVEAADALVVAAPARADGELASDVFALLGHLNRRARLVTPPGTGGAVPDSVAPLVPAVLSGAEEEWQARLEPVTAPSPRCGDSGRVRSVLWQTRRPLHPERLADALPTVMRGVVRGRGHVWLCSRPESVVTWRSAGPYLELREADRWLEAADARAWKAASPQRRTLASWFWDDYYGERRNVLALTGIDLDREEILSVLDAALLTDAELSWGEDAWTSVSDPLLSEADPQ